MATTGLHVAGGIASVSRCITRVLDEQIAAGALESADRLSLNDLPDVPGPLRGQQRFARRRQLVFAWHAWRMVASGRPDLVLIDHVGLGRAFRLPLPGLPPPRLAVFIHGRELDGVHGPHRESVILRADRILTNSDYTAAIVREQYPAVAERIHPVLLCLDPGLVARWEELPEAPGDRTDAVLVVGRLWSDMPGKGHDTLLEAWPRVQGAVPGAELWIAGEGDDRPRLERKARSLGLGEAVRFLGYVSDEELSRRYRRAAVFAMPSRQEGFGLVYGEALWHGLPCLGSTSDAAGTVIRDGETGVLVPYGDAEATAAALVELLRDPERRRRMGEAGRRDARERWGYERFRKDLVEGLGLA